jgi:hypothetical protein
MLDARVIRAPDFERLSPRVNSTECEHMRSRRSRSRETHDVRRPRSAAAPFIDTTGAIPRNWKTGDDCLRGVSQSKRPIEFREARHDGILKGETIEGH